MPDYILTPEIESPDLEDLTQLRDRYFPAERNYLQAHITLFHKLPGEGKSRWMGDLEERAAQTPSLKLTLTAPYSLGRGFAVKAESEALVHFRSQLAERWWDFLSPQDRSKKKFHLTLQNKVESEKARADLETFSRDWVPRSLEIRSMQVWEYAGGPWILHRKIELISTTVPG